MATQLRRKVYEHEIKVYEMPVEIQEVMKLLDNESYLAVKGGYAKMVLGEILKQQGKNPEAVAHPKGTYLDLDIVLTFVGTKRKNLDVLDERVAALTEKLSGIDIELNPADVETIKGNLDNQKTIVRFLESRDLTINEVIAVPKKNGSWTLYYTDKCYRDTLNGSGIIGANGSSVARIDAGRWIAGPYGITRLLRFLIEGKVNKIYLPQWWIDLNNKEAKKMNRENLGSYGMILCRRYEDNPHLQKKMMFYLNKLGITDIKNFKKYMEEQELFFQLHTNEKFSFSDDRPFIDIQKHLEKKDAERMQSYQERKKVRESCVHKTKTFVCEHCAKKCIIKKCAYCTMFEVTHQNEIIPPNNLLCNHNFRTASVHWDKNGFFPNAGKIKVKIAAGKGRRRL